MNNTIFSENETFSENRTFLEKVMDEKYEQVSQIMSMPIVRLDFDDQVCMRECTNIKMFELLSIHPTTDPCRFNNDECLVEEHHIDREMYDKLGINILDLCQTIQKLPTSNELDDKIIRTSIRLQINQIAQECENNRRIMEYIKFLTQVI